MMNDNVLQCDKLSKRYGAAPSLALKDLSLQVKRGEVYGFLGPNGAGKSTTIRTLLNFIQPTSGQATILGKDIVKDSLEIKKHIGYLSGDFNAYSKMTGHQFLDYLSELQPARRKGRKEQLAKLFRANLNKKISDLSKGNRQKIGIIQAFIHEPELYILDEPTDGLDPLMQEAFYHLVDEAQTQGASVFVSSHNLAEVRKMCDRVGFIRDGKLIAEWPIAELAQAAAQTFDLIFANPVTEPELRRISGVKNVTANHSGFSLELHGDLGPLLTFLAKQKVTHLTTRELNLEEQFLKYYETESRR
jgi:ABC-2 type transport system ATP-binding protein